MTITVNKIIPRPKIWYPMGAGGMWLNYLIWCHWNKKNLPDDFRSFEYPDLRKKYSAYQSYITFTMHTLSPDQINDCQIRLGGNQWFNFYMNIISKKPQDFDSDYRVVVELLLQMQSNNQGLVNLEWKNIFVDPEKFLKTLGSILGYNISYNKVTQQAIAQYVKSCAFPVLNSEFQSGTVYQHWAQTVARIKNIQDPDQILEFTQCCYYHPAGLV